MSVRRIDDREMPLEQIRVVMIEKVEVFSGAIGFQIGSSVLQSTLAARCGDC